MGTLLMLIIFGCVLGMLYFLLASGLSLIFGLMKVLNFAQGALFMIGAYVSYTVMTRTGNFLLSILAAAAVIAILGFFIEQLLIKPLKGNHSNQILMSFGLIYVFDELVKIIWGTKTMVSPKPAILSSSLQILEGGLNLPAYSVFILVISLFLFLSLMLLLRKTKIGIIIRAGIDKPDMVKALGIDVDKVFTLTFVIGTLMAGIGGGIAAPYLNVYPTMGSEQLFNALIVCVVGGLGSYAGTFIAGLAVGIMQTLIGYYAPNLAMASTILIMMGVLIIKPEGLISIGGKKGE